MTVSSMIVPLIAVKAGDLARLKALLKQGEWEPSDRRVNQALISAAIAKGHKNIVSYLANSNFDYAPHAIDDLYINTDNARRNMLAILIESELIPSHAGFVTGMIDLYLRKNTALFKTLLDGYLQASPIQLQEYFFERLSMVTSKNGSFYKDPTSSTMLSLALNKASLKSEFKDHDLRSLIQDKIPTLDVSYNVLCKLIGKENTRLAFSAMNTGQHPDPFKPSLATLKPPNTP